MQSIRGIQRGEADTGEAVLTTTSVITMVQEKLEGLMELSISLSDETD